MKIQEDIEDLKHQIKGNIDSPGKVKMGDLLKQAFSVCENLKEMLKTCSQEDKKKISEILLEFREFLVKESTRMSQKMGISREELAKRNENPDNFSKTEWNAMQGIRQSFLRKAKEIRGAAKSNPSLEGPKPYIKVTRGLPPAATKAPKRVSKKKWMKT